MFSITHVSEYISFIHVSEYVFYNPCFRVRFLLSKFQSMFSIIHVSECVFYYPSFRVCFLLLMFQSIFLLSMFQSMFSIIHVSEYFFKCKQNNSLYKICWRLSFASFLDINDTHCPVHSQCYLGGKLFT